MILENARRLNEIGDFETARGRYQQCLDTLTNSTGVHDPRVTEAVCQLGICLGNLGRYEEAETIIRQYLDATIDTCGESSGQTADIMLALAEVLSALGKQVESIKLYRRAAAIMTAIYQPNDPRLAPGLSGLAHTERRMGNSPEAELLYRRCIELVETEYGTKHPDLIHYRSRLGMCLFEQIGKFDRGLANVERAIDLAKELYGEGSYQVAMEERQLGLLLEYDKRYEEAYVVLKRSLATLERFFGPNHPFLSKCLKGLTGVSYQLGLVDEAYDYINRAVALHEHSSGRDQLEKAFLLGWKLIVELYLRNWDAALATAFQSSESSKETMNELYQVTSTRDALLYAQRPETCVESLVGAAVAGGRMTDSTAAAIFSRVADTHGQVLDWLAERHRYLEMAADSGRVDRARRDFVSASQRVANLAVGGPQSEEEKHRDALDAARRERDSAERELSAATERLRWMTGRRRGAPDLSLPVIGGKLEPGSMLIHFVQFMKWLYPTATDQIRIEHHYGAFCVRKAASGALDLKFVDLGPAMSINSLIFSYRETIDDVQRGQRPTARDEAQYRTAARRLFKELWKPLVSQDENTWMEPPIVFVIPVSFIYLVDFNSLLAPSGDLVIERWKLHLLSSARDLLRPRETPHTSGMLAVGNPNANASAADKLAQSNRVERGSHKGICAGVELASVPLPGAEVETRAVAELYEKATGEPSTVLIGPDASEESVKALLANHRVAHFATHGFFCDEGDRKPVRSAARLTDPLLKSGLVLSEGPGEDDGLLTAQELVCTDLRGLDWVVLSACGSGLGRLVIGEGLFGLRRAFRIAGARTVIMALWRIGDVETRKLMEEIYRLRLAGNSTIDAVRTAQLERLRDQRRRLNRIHPATWGGIVAEGDWR